MSQIPPNPADRPQTIHTWQDAEQCAAAWMRAMGHPDAQVTAGGADGGIDVAGQHAVAQVKFRVVKSSRPELQQLLGAANRRDIDLYFFSVAGYTADALTWAEQVGIAAFQLGLDGYITPLNEHAVQAARVAAAVPQWRSHVRHPDAPSPQGTTGAVAPAAARAGFWRRVGIWFGRLFRTVAWEAGDGKGQERTPDKLMTGAELMGAGLGITIFGIIGVVAMTGTAFDPIERANGGVAQAIGGIIFYGLVAVFGGWARKLGARRKNRHDGEHAAPPV